MRVITSLAEKEWLLFLWHLVVFRFLWYFSVWLVSYHSPLIYVFSFPFSSWGPWDLKLSGKSEPNPGLCGKGKVLSPEFFSCHLNKQTDPSSALSKIPWQLCFFFLAVPWGTQDLKSLARNWIHVPCGGSTDWITIGSPSFWDVSSSFCFISYLLHKYYIFTKGKDKQNENKSHLWRVMILPAIFLSIYTILKKKKRKIIGIILNIQWYILLSYTMYCEYILTIINICTLLKVTT